MVKKEQIKEQITDSQQFQEQIDAIKELKEHKKKAKRYATIGCFLPCCFCPAAYYHYRKARK